MRHYRIARSSGNDCHLWASEAEHIPHLDVVGRTWEVTMILVLMFLILQFYLLYRNNNVSNKSRTWISLIGLVCVSCHGNFCDENASRVGQIQQVVHTECTFWKGFGGVSRWIPQKKIAPYRASLIHKPCVCINIPRPTKDPLTSLRRKLNLLYTSMVIFGLFRGSCSPRPTQLEKKKAKRFASR